MHKSSTAENFKEYNVFENILKVVQSNYDGLKKTFAEKSLDYTFFDIDFGAKKDHTKGQYKDLQGNSVKLSDININQIKFLVEKVNDTIGSDLSVFKITLKKAPKPTERPQISTLTIGFLNKTYSGAQEIFASAKKNSSLTNSEPPKCFNINRCLNDFAKSRDNTRGISQEMKMFFNEMLIGCPMVLAICNISKFPKDLKLELNSLSQFSKKSIKEESQDNKNIRDIIDELENLKKENTLMNFTCVNQQERVNTQKDEVEQKTQSYEQNNQNIEGRLKEMETKGKNLVKLQGDFIKLKNNSKRLISENDVFEKKIEEKSKDIDQMDINLDEEKNNLSQHLHSLTTKNHKHSEEFNFLSKKLNESESLLSQKCVVHETLKSTNELFQKSSYAIQSYVNQCEGNVKTPTKVFPDFNPYENTLDSNLKQDFRVKNSRKNYNRYITRSSYQYLENSPTHSDVDLEEIENNYKMLEKEKVIFDLKTQKDKLSKECQYKDEKINEMSVHVNYFSKLQDDLPAENFDENNHFDAYSDQMNSDTFSQAGSSRIDFSMLIKNGFDKLSHDNGSNYLGKRCGNPSTDLSRSGAQGSLDNESGFEWGCKRLKIDQTCVENVKSETRYLNGRIRILQDCINVNNCHASYCYKKAGDLNLKKHHIEDHSIFPAIDFYSTLE